MRQRVGAICGYGVLALLGAAVVLPVPDLLTGLATSRGWPYQAALVTFFWLAAFLVRPPSRLALTMAATTLVAAIAMRVAINTFGLKETAEALWMWDLRSDVSEENIVGLLESACFLFAGILLAAGFVATRYGRQPPRIGSVAGWLLVSLGTVLALDIVGSLLGFSQFFDPLDLAFRMYLGPLAASAIVVLIWNFIAGLPSYREPPAHA